MVVVSPSGVFDDGAGPQFSPDHSLSPYNRHHHCGHDDDDDDDDDDNDDDGDGDALCTGWDGGLAPPIMKTGLRAQQGAYPVSTHFIHPITFFGFIL